MGIKGAIVTGLLGSMLSMNQGCNSNLKVKTSQVPSETSVTSDADNSNDPASQENTTSSKESSEPGAFQLSFVISSEDGQNFNENTVLNAKKPKIIWDNQNKNISSIRIIIAQDHECKEVLFQFDESNMSSRSLDFLNDGSYYFCIFGVSASGTMVPANNNGLKLGLDRTAPKINGTKVYFFNQKLSPTLAFVDQSPVTIAWSQKSGPGLLTIANSSDLNPQIEAPQEGLYMTQIAVTDTAGNSSQEDVAITWDITPPVITSFTLANEASDGQINTSEAASTANIATLTASGQNKILYTAILNDSPPVVCDQTQNYTSSSIPKISSIGGDGTFALCVKLSDAAGNVTYGKSPPVIKNTAGPSVNAGIDVVNHTAFMTASTVTNAVTYAWSKTTGPGTITFADSSAMNTSVSASADGTYTLTLTATDAAGNNTSDSLILIWDTIAPTFTSLVGANGASDGYVNATEYLSPALLFTLSATNYLTVAFTAVLPSTVTCDNSQTYNSNIIPSISDIPGIDGSYVICVMLTDAAGNVTYGKSDTVVRDITPPSFVSLTGTNQATDGYINNSEKNSNLTIMTLSASDYLSVNYSNILDDTPSITCNSGITYPNGSAPLISSMPAVDDTYTVCVKLSDAAGNATYGKGSNIIRDTIAPIATLSGTPTTYTRDSNFNVTVSGTDVYQYTYGVQTWTSTWCSSYSSPIDVSTLITAPIGSDGNKTLCVIAYDLAGNAQSPITYYNFGKLTTASAATSFLTMRDTGSSVSMSWNSVGVSVGTNSYLIVRGVGSGSTNAFTPVDGTAYSVGNIGTDLDIVYLGTTASFNDTSATSNKIYEYAIYTVTVTQLYSPTAGKGLIAYFPMPDSAALESPHINLHAQENSYANRVALSNDGLTMAVGAAYHPLDASNLNPLSRAGAVFVYTRPNTSSSWTLEQKLVGTGVNGRQTDDYFGYSISLNPTGNLLAVGSQNGYDELGGGYISKAGAIFVFSRSGGVWSLQQKVIGTGVNGRISSDMLGDNVALTNDTLVISSINQDYDEAGGNLLGLAGAVFVYRLSGSTWTLEQKLVPNGVNARNSSDMFGRSVTIDGDTIAVGTIYHQFDDAGNNPLSMAGAVFVYTRSGSTWTQQAKLVPSGANARLASIEFGTNVSLVGDILAVGAPNSGYDATGVSSSGGAGQVFIFKRTTGVWSQLQRLSPAVNSGIAKFGTGISLKGNTLLVGGPIKYLDATEQNSIVNAGLAWIYGWNGSSWNLTQKINASGTNARINYDEFARYVALAGTENSIVIGSSNGFDSAGLSYAPYAGAVFTFENSGTWSQTQKTTDNSIQSRSRGSLKFGNDIYVAPDGLSMLVGAPNDPTDANGDNLTTWNIGAVYYYTRASRSSSWTLSQKIVPFGVNGRFANVANQIRFGYKFAVDGSTLVVGAPSHSYDANGANFSIEAGAIFTFNLSGGVWTPHQVLAAGGTNSRYYYDNFGTSVALSGDTIVVGAPRSVFDSSGINNVNNAGTAYLFTRSGGVWSQVARFSEEGTNARSLSNNFGNAVATNGTYTVIGSFQNGYDRDGNNYISNAGLVRIYKNTAGTWNYLQTIDQPANRKSDDKFGYSLAMDSTTLLIGSIGNRYSETELLGNTAGAVYIFTENAGTFVLQQKLKGFGTMGASAGSEFGGSVALYGGNIAVGSTSHQYDEQGANFISQAGAVFTFYKSGTTWYPGRKYLNFGPNGRKATSEKFGFAVSIGTGIFAATNINTDLDESTGTIFSVDKGTTYIFQQP